MMEGILQEKEDEKRRAQAEGKTVAIATRGARGNYRGVGWRKDGGVEQPTITTEESRNDDNDDNDDEGKPNLGFKDSQPACMSKVSGVFSRHRPSRING